MNKIYKAEIDTIRSGDAIFDAMLIPFEGSNKVRHYFSNPNIHEVDSLPSKLYFAAVFDYLLKYDVLWTDSGLFIYSKKVIQVLKDFDGLDFVEVPMIMIDDTFLGQRFDNDGNLNPKAPIMDGYRALRFSELKDYFDFENSEYTVPKYNPTGTGATLIKRLVLIEPEDGFPPLFRTKQKSSTIFVREDLKQALEANDIKGYIFEEIEVTPFLSK